MGNAIFLNGKGSGKDWTPETACHIMETGYDRSGPYGNERQGNRKLLQATSDKTTELNKKALQ